MFDQNKFKDITMTKHDTVKEIDSITSSMIVCKTALSTVEESDVTFSIMAMQDEIVKRLNRLAEAIETDDETCYHWLDSNADMHRITLL